MTSKKVCRVCLSSSKSSKFLKIFEDGGKIGSNINLVADIFVVEISKRSPALICEECLDKLKIAIEFRELCRKSDLHFRKLNKIDEEKSFKQNYVALQQTLLRQVKEVITIQPIVKIEPDTDLMPNFKCETFFDESEEDDTNLFNDDWILSDIDIQANDSKGNNIPESEKKLKKAPLKKVPNLQQLVLVQSAAQIASLQCKICQKICTTAAALKKHLYRHTQTGKKGSVSCSRCNEFYPTYRSLEFHLKRRHDKEGPYKCDHCGKNFVTRSKLKKHILNTVQRTRQKIGKTKQPRKPRMKQVNLQSTICMVCGKNFESKGAITRHELTHREFKPSDYFYCDLCGYKFKEKHSMGFHMKTRHIENKRFHCPHCPNRSWLKRHQMNEHIRVVHEKIFDFFCEFCGKGHATKSKLKQHVRIHTGETPYQCRYCERRFIQNTDCRRHEWSHTGFKGNIKCPHCNQGFFKNSDLLSHLPRCVRRAY